MRIAVIGTGNMGSGFARALSRSHDVVVGSRDRNKGEAVAAEAGATGTAAYQEAARDAEVVFITLPWHAVEETIRGLGDLTGKIVVDVTNPFVEGKLQPLEGTSTAEEVARWAPGARVVKGWNHVFARNLADPEVHGQAPTVFLAGDDGEAKEVVAGLARDMGFDPYDAGGLDATRHLERLLGAMWGIGLDSDSPLKVLRRG